MGIRFSKVKNKFVLICSMVPVHIMLFGVGGYIYLKRNRPPEQSRDEHFTACPSSDEHDTDVEEDSGESEEDTPPSTGQPQNLTDLEVVLRNEGWLDTPWPVFNADIANHKSLGGRGRGSSE